MTNHSRTDDPFHSLIKTAGGFRHPPFFDYEQTDLFRRFGHEAGNRRADVAISIDGIHQRISHQLNLRHDWCWHSLLLVTMRLHNLDDISIREWAEQEPSDGILNVASGMGVAVVRS